MSPIPALRTYTFASAPAAKTFSSFFKLGAASLSQNHDVRTSGVFLSQTNPNQIIALVHYPAGSEPKEVMGAYVKSEAFKKDAEGMPLKDLQGIEEVLLDAVEF